MNQFSLSRIAARLDAERQGPDVEFSALATDSRASMVGALFVALTGERFDGHDFVSAAKMQGAVAAVVEHPVDVDIPQVVVANARIALGRIAGLWREASPAQVVAVTGSNGKTTLKEMLAAILRQRGEVLATRGNLNNDIGVPLTLSRLANEEFAVVEMGANHPGEIDYLARLTQPHVAVLNNAGRAHLEGFGTLEGVARAKAEIINGLSDDGVFVCPGDSRWSGLWRELAYQCRILTFGTDAATDISSPGDARIEWTDTGFHQVFPVVVPGGEFQVRLSLAGAHNRRNALAAIAGTHALGIDMEAMAVGLAELHPVAGRLCPVAGRGGVRIVDDTYNANPESVIAAINVLVSAPGKRVLILGDLAELGPDSVQLHRELGVQAQESGLDALYTLGDTSRHASAAFGGGASHFDELAALVETVSAAVRTGDTVLVKGSRGARMERVVSALVDEEKVAC